MIVTVFEVETPRLKRPDRLEEIIRRIARNESEKYLVELNRVFRKAA